MRRRDEPSRFEFSLVHDLSPADDVRQHETELDDIEETEREELVRSRVG